MYKRHRVFNSPDHLAFPVEVERCTVSGAGFCMHMTALTVSLCSRWHAMCRVCCRSNIGVWVALRGASSVDRGACSPAFVCLTASAWFACARSFGLCVLRLGEAYQWCVLDTWGCNKQRTIAQSRICTDSTPALLLTLLITRLTPAGS